MAVLSRRALSDSETLQIHEVSLRVLALLGAIAFLWCAAPRGAAAGHTMTPADWELFEAIAADDTARVEAAVTRGASVNEARDGQGESPLMAACGKGSLEMVKVLKRFGADLNLPVSTGLTYTNALFKSLEKTPVSSASWGGRTNKICNNPLAAAVPTLRHPPIVLDMAMSVAAGGRVRLAAKKGEKIPTGWIVNKDGKNTDDPNDLPQGGALLLLGYKGYVLAIIGEVLSGLLSGAKILDEIPMWFSNPESPVGNGHFHMAIDILDSAIQPCSRREWIS